jgi:hypothetical protein
VFVRSVTAVPLVTLIGKLMPAIEKRWQSRNESLVQSTITIRHNHPRHHCLPLRYQGNLTCISFSSL